MMLSLEQCKSLKSWGFPQPERSPQGVGHEAPTAYCITDTGGIAPTYHCNIDWNIWSYPKLEELIKWLVPYFPRLYMLDYDQWEASCYRKNHVTANRVLAKGPGPLSAVYALCEAMFGGG